MSRSDQASHGVSRERGLEKRRPPHRESKTDVVRRRLGPRCLLLVFATAFMATGCHLLYRPHWSQFRALCEDPGRNFIARKVTADGFLHEDFSCLEKVDEMLKYDFKYCESWRSPGLHGEQLYRYTIDPDKCRAEQTSRGESGPFREPPSEQCMAREPIEHPRARYVFKRERGVVMPSGEHVFTSVMEHDVNGAIIFSRYQVVDRDSEDVIAQRIFYKWWIFGGRGPPAPPPLPCSENDEERDPNVEWLYQAFVR